MPYTDHYEEHFGKGVLARVQYKEIDEDYVVPMPDTLKVKRIDSAIGDKNIMEYEFE